MRYEFELVLPTGGDFDACRNRVWTQEEARDNIDCLLEDSADAEKLTLVSATFVEFDSSNPSHACGYWNAVFEGPEGIQEFREEEE
jgi:hypothetical protein